MLAKFELRPPATREAIGRVEDQLGVRLPDDYVDFLTTADGGEGPVGEDGYLALWSVGELAELNEEYCTDEFVPGVLLIGSDRGGTAYGIDARTERPRFVSVPFVPMELDEVSLCGDGSFKGLLVDVGGEASG